MLWLERLVLLVVSLVLLAGGIGLFAFVLGWQGTGFVTWLLSLKEAPFDGAVVGAALLLVALYLLALVARRQGRESVICQETKLGQVQISLKAVETLVRRAAREVGGIRELIPVVKAGPEGLIIRVSMQVAPDLSIPDLSDAVQTRIREYLQETVGAPVRNILVEVRNIHLESKGRVE